MQAEMYYDRKHDFALEQVGEAAAGDGAGGLGGLGGEEGGLGGPPPEPGAEEEALEEPEEAGPLLAAPGPGGAAPEIPTPGAEEAPAKRDSYGRPTTTTPASRHSYHTPSKYTGGDRRKTSGARSAALHGLAGMGPRSVFPGKREFESLYRFSEGLEPNYYEQEEEKLFQENNEIKKLIESLEKTDNEV